MVVWSMGCSEKECWQENWPSSTFYLGRLPGSIGVTIAAATATSGGALIPAPRMFCYASKVPYT